MLSVWGYPEFASRSVVKPTGTITIPLVGELLAAGFKRNELIPLVRQRLSEYIKGDIKISLDVIRPPARIMVLGSVNRPGSFASNIDLPLLEVLATVGGWTTDADLRFVRINRAAQPSGDGTTFEVDVDDALERGDVRSLPMIHSGDAVIVPRSSNFVREFGDFFRDAILVLGLIGLTR
jgi:polysaccharide export outer membrane protein